MVKPVLLSYLDLISRVSGQNGVSLLYIMLEIHHSGREPLICSSPYFFVGHPVLPLDVVDVVEAATLTMGHS